MIFHIVLAAYENRITAKNLTIFLECRSQDESNEPIHPKFVEFLQIHGFSVLEILQQHNFQVSKMYGLLVYNRLTLSISSVLGQLKQSKNIH